MNRGLCFRSLCDCGTHRLTAFTGPLADAGGWRATEPGSQWGRQPSETLLKLSNPVLAYSQSPVSPASLLLLALPPNLSLGVLLNWKRPLLFAHIYSIIC